MAPILVDVPAPVAQVATAALDARQERQEGGTARGVVIATALACGHATPAELLEARDWHRRNPDAIREGRSTILAGLYGGAPGRSWLAVAPIVAAARNPEGTGAMIALPVPDEVAKALARDDGEPISSFHLTMFHLASDATSLDPELRDAYAATVARAVTAARAPKVVLTHVERFTATDEGLEPVVVVSDSPEVYELRAQIAQALTEDGLEFARDHAFRAHVTIGYYPPGDGPAAGPLEGALEDGLVLTPEAVKVYWGPKVTEVPFPVAAPTPEVAAPGHYVIQDGWPVEGPFDERADARRALEPGDDGVVYLDGTLPGGVLARAGAAPPSQERRRRRARLRRLAAGANRIDRDVARRLHAAVSAAYREAVRKATVKLEQRARTRPAKAALEAAGGLATPSVLAALGLEEQRLIEHSFSEVGDLAREWLAEAERRKLALAAKELRPDPTLGEDPDDEFSTRMLEARMGGEIDRRAEIAAGLLVAALGWFTLRRLSSGPPPPSQGEQRGDVPFRIIRGPLELVRTGREPQVIAADALSSDPPGLRQAIGDAVSNIDRLVREREPGATTTGVWVHGYYGEPSRPFEPHEALDGIGGPDDEDGPLTGLGDERLAKDPGEWPEGSSWAPDDHDGCTCEIVQEYEPAESEPAEAQAASLGGSPPLPAAPEGSATARVAQRVAARR